MSPTDIIRQVSADGVTLKVTPAGTLKATGDQAAIDRWLPVLKARKPDIIAELMRLPAGLEFRLRAMARRWQYSTEELAHVLDRAQRDPAAWSRAIALDERHEAAFREQGLLPQTDA
jgi:hypothetical protein